MHPDEVLRSLIYQKAAYNFEEGDEVTLVCPIGDIETVVWLNPRVEFQQLMTKLGLMIEYHSLMKVKCCEYIQQAPSYDAGSYNCRA